MRACVRAARDGQRVSSSAGAKVTDFCVGASEDRREKKLLKTHAAQNVHFDSQICSECSSTSTSMQGKDVRG